jgi:hypothetical protein
MGRSLKASVIRLREEDLEYSSIAAILNISSSYARKLDRKVPSAKSWEQRRQYEIRVLLSDNKTKHCTEQEIEALLRLRLGVPRTYFLLCSTTKLVKIGYSCQHARRIQLLASQNSTELTLLGICDTPEKQLHKAFEHLNHHGEWFRYTDELKTAIHHILAAFTHKEAHASVSGILSPTRS